MKGQLFIFFGAILCTSALLSNPLFGQNNQPGTVQKEKNPETVKTTEDPAGINGFEGKQVKATTTYPGKNARYHTPKNAEPKQIYYALDAERNKIKSAGAKITDPNKKNVKQQYRCVTEEKNGYKTTGIEEVKEIEKEKQ